MNKLKKFAAITNEALSTITGGQQPAAQPPVPTNIWGVCSANGAAGAGSGDLEFQTPVGLKVKLHGDGIVCNPPATPPATPSK